MSQNLQFVTYTLALLGLMSFSNFSRAHYLPMGFIFELCWLFLLATLIFSSFIKQHLLAAFIVFAYSITFLSNSLLRGIHILDVILALKPLIYLSSLFLYRGHRLDYQAYQKISYIFLLIFLFKYSVSVGFGLNSRPLVFRENNFELLFLLSFLLPDLVVFQKVPKVKLALFVFVFFLSGSKSGMIILLFFIMSLFIDKLRPSWLKLFAYLFVPIIGFVFLITVLGVNTSVDRLAMARAFIQEVGERDITNLLFGVLYLQPLSPETCKMLHFYPGLFSYANDGTCFPLILHLAHLRFLLDHSVLFLFLYFMLIIVILSKLQFKAHSTFIILTPVFLQGLSVSSYYSPYFVIYMFIIISTQRTLNAKKVV